jgi:XTP/dITP diphosphohydrolase
MDEVVPEPLDIEETGKSYYENALIKVKAVSKYTSLPIMSDDSGLEVKALDNMPGIYSARYAEKEGGYIPAMKKIIDICKEKVNLTQNSSAVSFY